MQVTFEWEEPDNAVPGYIPSEYFILLYDLVKSFNFRVKNATNITIFPLNATKTYYTFVSDCVVMF